MSDPGMFVAVAVAGGIGAALRYLADNAVPASLRARYPWGTTVVNVSGSFALGLLTGLTTSTWHTIVAVGLIGGYTTFSTASLETLELVADRRWVAAASNSVGMLTGCAIAALAGFAIAQA